MSSAAGDVISLDVDPAPNLEPAGQENRWRAVDDQPVFALHARTPLAAGWYVLEADLVVALSSTELKPSDRAPARLIEPSPAGRTNAMGFQPFELRPSLRIVANRTVEPLQTVPLRKPRSGKLRALIELPEDLRSLALEPCRAPGIVALRNVRLTPKIGWHLSWAGLRELLRSPGGVSVALRAWLTGGLPWVRTKVRQAVRHDYRRWIDRFDVPTRSEQRAIDEWIAGLDQAAERRPRFRMIVQAGASVPGELIQTVESLREQRWPDWQLFVVAPTVLLAQMLPADLADPRIVRFAVDRGSASESWAAVVDRLRVDGRSDDWLTRIEVGDRLHPEGLVRLARAAIGRPTADVLYGDDDRIDRLGRRREPRCFEDWDLDLARSGALAGAPIWFQSAAYDKLVNERGGPEFETPDELLLRAAETLPPTAVVHVPRILLHRKTLESAKPSRSFEQRLAKHLQRLGETAEVRQDDGRLRVVYPLPDPLPVVSLVIGTRDRVDLLRPLVRDLLDRTDYGPSTGTPAIEVVIVDNGSREPETLEFFSQITAEGAESGERLRVIPFDGPFNHSAIYNAGVEAAGGEVVVLMNNDLRVRDSGWLREMVSQLCRPDVGAVGAKLLYGDGRLQHGGVVLGLGRGIAGHAGRLAPPGIRGRCGELRRVRRVSAVTAACLAIRRQRFLDLGGLDAVRLPVAYNDVDLCLRLSETDGVAVGERVIWTPFACLDHLEGESRGEDGDSGHPDHAERLRRLQGEEAYMRSQWGDRLTRDPWYNPNLTLEREDATLSLAPRFDPTNEDQGFSSAAR